MKPSEKRNASHSPEPPSISAQENHGNNAQMEARIIALESLAEKTLKRLTTLEVDVAVIKSNYATKEDLAKLEGTLLKWFIGTAVTMTSLAFAAAKFIN